MDEAALKGLEKIGFHADDMKRAQEEAIERWEKRVREEHHALHAKREQYEREQLRDQFAMAALTGCLASNTIAENKEIAEMSYELADAMLEARKR
jgi:phosphopantetheine adenylyltransferase